MKIYFIGIGGISMSGIANICLNLNYSVSGSDSQENSLTRELEKKGAVIHIGQDAKNITGDIDLIVYTAAIHTDNPEWIAAKNSGIKMMSRAEFLGVLMNKYSNSIAISGTHGKTSTTSMLSVIYSMASLDPTILVGGNLKDINGNYRVGSSPNFITEACEYFDSFLELFPSFALILNIEADHLDYFKDIDNIISSFHKFSENVKQGGYVIANGDDDNVRQATVALKQVVYFGFQEKNDAVIRNLTFNELGNASFSLHFHGEVLGTFELQVPGSHNVLNATAAILTGFLDGLPIQDLKRGIKAYRGVGRRFEYKGKYKEASVYDDYAHHPSEIKATLAASKYLHANRLISIFQPHTFSRTKSFLSDFAASFSDADLIIITDIYASREADEGTVSSKQLVDKIIENGKKAVYLKGASEIERYLNRFIQSNDVVFTIGAGDVHKIGEYLISLS